MMPFMRCTSCGRVGATWGVENEAYCCPECHMDESGLEVLNPQDLLGTKWRTGRGEVVSLVEWYGDNNFRAVRGTVYVTVGILSLKPAA